MSPTVQSIKPNLAVLLPTPEVEMVRRRGPLRPGALVPARARVGQRGFSGAFQFIDAALLSALALVAAEAAAEGPLVQAELAALGPFVVAAIASIWALRGFGGYEFGPRGGLGRHLGRIAAAFLTGVVPGVLSLSLFGAWDAFPAVLIWTAACFAGVSALHVAGWEVARRWRRSGKMRPNLVFVGATPNARRLIEQALASREVSVLGVFDDRLERAPAAINGVPVLGDTAALLGHRVLPCVDRVVITVSASAETRVRQLIDRLSVLPNEITLFIDVEGGERAAQTLSRVTGASPAFWTGDQSRAFNKRVQDLVLASIGLVFAAPLLLLVALAVRLDSPGPVLFRQRRHGFNNEEIIVYKFRSMRHDACDPAARRQVVDGDDRVTRVGRFIRRTSLDELPQLFNVLKGEMSIVGPRPHPVGMLTGEEETSRLVAEYAHRHRLKPGVTGWAQINGSRGPVHTPEEVRRRVALDVEYIERQSLWLDLYIVLMTLPRLLGDNDAVR